MMVNKLQNKDKYEDEDLVMWVEEGEFDRTPTYIGSLYGEIISGVISAHKNYFRLFLSVIFS